MRRLLVRRLIVAAVVLVGILLVCFKLLDVDIEEIRPQDVRPGALLTADEAERAILEFRRRHGLDDPFPARFARWVSRLARLDLGRSLRQPREVAQILGDAVGPTLRLQTPALILGYLFGIPLGVFMARRRGRAGDRILGVTLYGLYSVPTFWLATLLVTYLATDAGLALFPLEGEPPRHAIEGGGLAAVVARVRHLVLPVFALTLPDVIFISRLVRNTLADELDADWARTLRAAGIGESRIVWVFGLRRTAVPLAAQLGFLLPGLISGAIVVELIFNVPGTGRALWDATTGRDLPVQQALVFFTSTAVLLGFLASDVLCLWLDPKKGRTA